MATARGHRLQRIPARARRLKPPLTPLDQLVREHIRAHGPMGYGEVVERALYDPDHGFYATRGRAGRRGDFLTSPEVGPLFGHVVSRAIDEEWDALGQPSDFTIVEFGAGPGTLARAVLAAEPRCLSVATYIAVERSETQRRDHPDGVLSVEALDSERIGSGLTGVVFANELLDNLAFTPLQWRDETPLFATVEVGDDDTLVVAGEPHDDEMSGLIAGRSVVDQSAAAEWVNWVLDDVLATGRLIVIDYARDDTSEVTVRTYSEHGPAGDPLIGLGTKDVTVDVDIEVLERRTRSTDRRTKQSEWLTSHGIEELVEEGRSTWERLASSGGLDALKGLSRVREAEALCEFNGLGGFSVLEWEIR